MTLELGQVSKISKTISEGDLQLFAEVSLDKNPVHLDREYAAKTIFKRPIAHGMLSGSIISAVLANQMPGPGTIYLEQNLKFKAPVYVGDTVTAEVKLVEFIKPTIARCSTNCYNQDGTLVIEGEAVVKLP